MKKISVILESQTQAIIIERISTAKQFTAFVHEKLKLTKGYTETSARMIAEDLLDMYPDNFKKAAASLANFQMGS